MWTPERELLGLLAEIVLSNSSISIFISQEQVDRINELWKLIHETGERRDANANKLRLEYEKKYGVKL
jgi:hypothetical protein